MKSLITFFSDITIGKSLLLLLTPILTVILSMKAALLGLTLLIFIDLVTGIRKTHYALGIKFNPFKKIFWKSIKSYLLRQTWRKAYEYAIGILIVVIFESLVFGSPISVILMQKTFSLAELVTVIPALIEVWSIYENMEAVSNNNVFKKILFLLPAPVKTILKVKDKNKEITITEITEDDGI